MPRSTSSGQHFVASGCPFDFDLNQAITSLLRLDDNDDEVFSRYDDIMEKHSARVGSDRRSVKTEAANAYAEIMKGVVEE